MNWVVRRVVYFKYNLVLIKIIGRFEYHSDGKVFYDGKYIPSNAEKKFDKKNAIVGCGIDFSERKSEMCAVANFNPLINEHLTQKNLSLCFLMVLNDIYPRVLEQIRLFR